jgi:hypothetical protein
LKVTVRCSSESSGMSFCVLKSMLTDVSEVRAASETVDIDLRTWQDIPEDSELHTRRRENLKSNYTMFVTTLTLERTC